MIKIAQLQTHQVVDAKYVISGVAQRIYVPEKTAQEFYDILEEEGELRDMDDFQQAYVENRGLFYVVTDDDKVVGTGAIKKYDDKVAELKRLWLLEEYHGLGIGYRVVSLLFDFARAQGYERIWLQTSLKQERVIRFS